MTTKLTKQQKKIVVDNLNLVHYLIRKLKINTMSFEYDDVFSIGVIGLIKATTSFNPTKNTKFSTYASKCITNEIFRYFYYQKKYMHEIFFDEPTEKKFTIEYIISDADYNFVERIENTEFVTSLINIILNYLTGKQRLVMLYRIGNVSQYNIAKILHVCRSYVACLTAKALSTIREVTNYSIHYKKVLSFSIEENEYIISLDEKDISNLGEIFSIFLQNLIRSKELADFSVTFNQKQITIQLPAQPESFVFIAKLIQEIDNYNMDFVSTRN